MSNNKPTFFNRLKQAVNMTARTHHEEVSQHDVASCLFTLVSSICVKHLNETVAGLMIANHLVIITKGDRSKMDSYIKHSLMAYEQINANKEQALLATALGGIKTASEDLN